MIFMAPLVLCVHIQKCWHDRPVTLSRIFAVAVVASGQFIKRLPVLSTPTKSPHIFDVSTTIGAVEFPSTCCFFVCGLFDAVNIVMIVAN
jgi:hypothetical protein